MQKPVPVPIVVRVVVEADNGTVLNIWASTPEAEAWIASEAPAFGEFYRTKREPRRYTLIVPPTYRAQDVVDYLRNLTDPSS